MISVSVTFGADNMTEKLYLHDMYMKESNSTVTKIDGDKVYLDRTVFYPTGGGQPNDTGKISVNGSEANVIDVKKEGEEVAHSVDNPSILKVGDHVHCTIDWERRHALMRHHTAIHIMDAVVSKLHSHEGLITGSQIYTDRARMDFDMPTLNRDIAQQIIDESNKEIAQDRKIIVRNFTRDEALSMPNLARTEPGRELLKKLDTVRVVEIEGLDMQADGGLHVQSSKEVGKIILNGYKNQGSHSKRVEIRLE
jgi:misacylated tRNA(Ala) deacylase